jgi:hypothetical protein
MPERKAHEWHYRFATTLGRLRPDGEEVVFCVGRDPQFFPDVGRHAGSDAAGGGEEHGRLDDPLGPGLAAQCAAAWLDPVDKRACKAPGRLCRDGIARAPDVGSLRGPN